MRIKGINPIRLSVSPLLSFIIRSLMTRLQSLTVMWWNRARRWCWRSARCDSILMEIEGDARTLYSAMEGSLTGEELSDQEKTKIRNLLSDRNPYMWFLTHIFIGRIDYCTLEDPKSMFTDWKVLIEDDLDVFPLIREIILEWRESLDNPTRTDWNPFVSV